MVRGATDASLSGNHFYTRASGQTTWRGGRCPANSPFENKKPLEFKAAPKMDLTVTLRGTRNLKSSRDLQIAGCGCHKLKVFCTLSCMGKDTALSHTLTHARQGDSLTDIRIYIYINIYMY